jgi:hypothetical protein
MQEAHEQQFQQFQMETKRKVEEDKQQLISEYEMVIRVMKDDLSKEKPMHQAPLPENTLNNVADGV